MQIQKRTFFQSQLENMLSNQGELDAFKASNVFRTTIKDGAKPVLTLIKFHNLMTCYFGAELFDVATQGPSITVSISETGKWRYLARHRARTFSRTLKAA